MTNDIVSKIATNIDENISPLAILGYGSVVIPQKGKDKNSKYDFLVVVNDSNESIKKLIKLYPNSFSLFSKCFYKLYTKIPPDITFVSIKDKKENANVKMGIINKSYFIQDNKKFSHLYTAGRVHKQLRSEKITDELKNSINESRKQALHLALLSLNKPVVSFEEVFNSICNLSYQGDIRVLLKFENPNKVNDIVTSSYESLKQIYFNSYSKYYETFNDTLIVNLDLLKNDFKNIHEIKISNVNKTVSKLKVKVFKSSVTMLVKGALVTPLIPSIQYVIAKKLKYKNNSGSNS